MKNISELKKSLEILYAEKFCNIKDISLCKNDHCTCLMAAEISAYIQSVIPSPYYDYSIKDFTGKNSHKVQILDNKTVFMAKSKLIQYLWDKKVNIKNIDSFKDTELNTLSVIDQRKAVAQSLIIYSSVDSADVGSQQKGKTFIASIVMKEAIKRRLIPGNLAHSYGWVKYGMLKYHLSHQNNEEEQSKIVFLKNADWLVVDDISLDFAAKNIRSYLCSMLDSFFLERIEDKLPTILVFRFNTDEHLNEIEENYGIGMQKIVTDIDNTFIKI